jgi:transmembrane sensor
MTGDATVFDKRKLVIQGASRSGMPGTTSRARWHGSITNGVAALQHKLLAKVRRLRGLIDETPFSIALTIELTWLSKAQRNQLEALAPRKRQFPNNVVPFRSYYPDRVPRPPRAEPPPPKRRWHWPTASAVTVIVIAVASVVLYLDARAPTDYVSGIGERRVIHLEDGSAITMNTRSRMRVWFSRQRRDIELLEGEALFSAAHDASRPFRVHVGQAVIEAVGTEFNVYRRKQDTKVSVVEGRVKISSTEVNAGDFQRPPPPIAVSAWEEALVSGENGNSTPFGVERHEVTDEELKRSLAWINGQLSFMGASLQETLEEFNRYNRQKLEIGDSTLAQLRIGGIFQSTDVDGLIAELHKLFGIRATPVTNAYSDPAIRLERELPGPP